MKVWVSRKALTDGLLAADAGEGVYPNPRYVQVNGLAMELGRDAHETREAAVADAERRRVAKIASLRKQIARLEALTWEVGGA
jgi:hypothetical protein